MGQTRSTSPTVLADRRRGSAERAVDRAFAEGMRTYDIGRTDGTASVGERVAALV